MNVPNYFLKVDFGRRGTWKEIRKGHAHLETVPMVFPADVCIGLGRDRIGHQHEGDGALLVC